jgi:hypothetical protein
VHRVGSVTDTGDVFAERLLQVIDEGKRTATYKLALLMALIDACCSRVRHTWPCSFNPAHPHPGSSFQGS